MPAPRTRTDARDETPVSEKMTTDERLSTIDANLQAILHELQWRNDAAVPTPLEASTSKIMRRRTLDEMEAALRRLQSPEPRRSDDDSPLVLQDAITELILHRQLVADLMQAATSSYQRGLDAIRKMTER